MANTSLHAAKDAKNDEFYTRLEDINEEMNHYEDKFRGKVVFCNCDDPKWSNFWKYFHLNFEYLGLKKLIATHYESGEVQSYKIEYTGGNDEDFEDGIITLLQGNGDFRSPECLALLDEADIVVTNPPFSLFREYIQVLVEHNKEFLIIGNMNALHYREVFPLIMNNKVWLGISAPKEFFQPDGTVKKFGNIIWYTTLDNIKRHDWIDTPYLYKKKDALYPELYPKYDNYDAINVNKVNEIPMDYTGVMGVPDGFLNRYNPDQFEILGCTQRGCHDLVPDTKKYNNYVEMKQDGTRTGSTGNKTNENGNLEMNDGKHNYFINNDGHIVQSTYSRIFIRKKAGVNNG